MQEYTIFLQLDIKPYKFWDEVKKENKKIKGEKRQLNYHCFLEIGSDFVTNAPPVDTDVRFGDKRERISI